jgi:hypothetical protein
MALTGIAVAKFSTVTSKKQHCKRPVSQFLPPRQLLAIALMGVVAQL